MKYYGKIGYVDSVETSPGVWKESKVIERLYTGDIIRNTRRRDSGENLNDDVNISNEISIVADSFANQNFHLLRYAEWMGTRWKITNIDVQPPRLILSLGGVYNGEQA